MTDARKRKPKFRVGQVVRDLFRGEFGIVARVFPGGVVLKSCAYRKNRELRPLARREKGDRP